MILQKSERIKDVNGYEGIYGVTNQGRVWSYRRNKWLNPWKDDNGYSRITFSVNNEIKSPRLHRLVGKAFVDNKGEKPQVNHKNGIKSDCRASNLEWCTARENLQHAGDMGLNSVFKLSYEDKILICKMFSILKTRKSKIALLFGVTSPAIIYIIQTYMPLLATA